MHQPFYRDAVSGQYSLPWVYLHAIKEYTDMAAVLEQVPGARAVVNFTPSLVAQIDDYSRRIKKWLKDEGALPDPLLAALVSKDGSFDPEMRQHLLTTCFQLNHEQNMHRYTAYSRLWHLAEHARHHDGSAYLGPNYFTDLVTWYHLGWLAETERRQNFVARRLIEKGKDFTCQDRYELLSLIACLLENVTSRYRKLAEAGKIELSTTPYAHPILPLMLDFRTARETVPDAQIPDEPYPGGEARAIDHIECGKRAHSRAFGHMARGCWPAEGAVSEDTFRLLNQAGFDWCATGESLLHHSLGYNLREHYGANDLYQPWLVSDGQLVCFFRDDKLSDLIGFEYSRWDTADAVANLMHELAGIHHRTRGMKAPVAAIIMDGENAWEHYHENGVPFLSSLYQSLAEHPDYELTTFSAYLSRPLKRQRLDKVVPGSWVYGNLATWIGDPAKTRGWELLIAAKKAFDKARQAARLGPDQLAAAEEQLRICEGSDWCWWFGDYNPGKAVRDFDRLYRQHLAKLYDLLGMPAPHSLTAAISEGGGDAEGGGTMRRNV